MSDRWNTCRKETGSEGKKRWSWINAPLLLDQMFLHVIAVSQRTPLPTVSASSCWQESLATVTYALAMTADLVERRRSHKVSQWTRLLHAVWWSFIRPPALFVLKPPIRCAVASTVIKTWSPQRGSLQKMFGRSSCFDTKMRNCIPVGVPWERYLTYTLIFKRLWECTFWTWEWKGRLGSRITEAHPGINFNGPMQRRKSGGFFLVARFRVNSVLLHRLCI